jgi:hypothetical protein
MPSRTVPRRSRADLVAEIYDAMLDPEGWGRLGDIVCRAVAGETAVAYVSHAAAVSDFIHHNIPGEAVARYGAYYHAVDPLFAMNRRNISGRAEGIFSYALLPEHEFAETEFYRDFGRGVATFHMLGCGLPIDAERSSPSPHIGPPMPGASRGKRSGVSMHCCRISSGHCSFGAASTGQIATRPVSPPSMRSPSAR